METAYHQTPLGIARISAEDGFITSIYLLDGEYEIKPAEQLLLKTAVLQLDEYFAGERKVFDLPIKQKGSVFQQRVWDQLVKIKYGSTITYLQQAKLMNNPLGIRAIASANGKNNLVIIVPCHRVIGSNGSLTGFGAGIWRKKWLLEHEARTTGIGQTALNF